MGFDPVSYAMGAKAGGGGGGVTVVPLSVSENGVYTAPSGKAYSPVTVAVPAEYKFTSSSSSLNYSMSGKDMTPPVSKINIVNSYSSATSAISVLSSFVGADHVVLTVDNGISNLRSGFGDCGASHITINGDTSACTEFKNCFNYVRLTDLRITVDGDPIDLSGVTVAGNLTSFLSNVVVDIRFVPNTCSVSWNNSTCANFSDATLVSIANALNSSATGQTLTLHATPKARCQTLMGTVTDGVFTADASGTVTLADFITQTKGWTLA